MFSIKYVFLPTENQLHQRSSANTAFSKEIVYFVATIFLCNCPLAKLTD